MVLNQEDFRLVTYMTKVIKDSTVGEDDAVMFDDSMTFMSMSKQMIFRFHLHNALKQWCITPISGQNSRYSKPFFIVEQDTQSFNFCQG